MSIYTEINNLEKTIFIGGTAFTFTFNLWDEDGSVLNVSAASCKWTLCPYGDTSYAVLTKTNGNGVSIVSPSGAGDCYKMVVTLSALDTQLLSGEYIQQPIVADFYGKVFRPGQGIVIIKPAIKNA